MKYKSTLIGDKFGMLTVINLSNKSKTKSITGRIWKCKCDCGNECDVDTGKLTSKNTRSCGCLKTLKNTQLDRKKIWKISCY